MQANPATSEWARTLRRPHQGRMIGGVAAGLADYFHVHVVLVRVVLAVLAVGGRIGVPLYLAAWLLVPDEGHDEAVVEELLGYGRPGGAWGCRQQPSGTAMASAPGTGPHPERSDDGPAT